MLLRRMHLPTNNWRLGILICTVLLVCFVGYRLSTRRRNDDIRILAEKPAIVEQPETDVAPTPELVTPRTTQMRPKSFTVEGNSFIKDGEAFSFRAGTAHYWRRPSELWEDTMIKTKALGLNAIQTYISWNLHEPEPEQYNFDPAIDFRRYFQLAHQHGLLVIVRPGPFINAEVDMGGFPYWLLRLDRNMKLRTSDRSYFQYVERWFRKLIPMLKDLLYENGGPIVMVQIENEYGSFPACDMQYRVDLRNLVRELIGNTVLLYTTDGPRKDRLACGRINDTVTTVDFGAGAETELALSILRESVPVGPFMNSEFYPGWIDHWGQPWKSVPVDKILKTTKELLNMKASFTIYPLVGGTNFGFTIGANMYGSRFLPLVTSYDFDSPISESGELTEKYMQLRELFKSFGYVPEGDLPPQAPKRSYGKIPMTYSGSVFENLPNLCRKSVKADKPMSFEDLLHPYGFVIYRTVISKRYSDPARLSVGDLHDRAVVFVNQERRGILSRTSGLVEVNLFVQPGDVLDLLVQNEGRVTVGPFIKDFKGILGEVTLQNETLSAWEMFPLDLPSYPVKHPEALKLVNGDVSKNASHRAISAFYTGKFVSDPACDTFLKLGNWGQGYAFVNGYNLGRYWSVVGPQYTLFVPSAFLKKGGENIIQVFEVDGSPCSEKSHCHIESVAVPVIGDSVERIHEIYELPAAV